MSGRCVVPTSLTKNTVFWLIAVKKRAFRSVAGLFAPRAKVVETTSYGTTFAGISRMNLDSKSALDTAKRLAESGHYGESAEAFEKVFEEQSRNPEALVALADVMAGMGQAESSLALLADSVDAADPSLSTLVKIADQLAGVGRLGESADFLIHSIVCHPGNPALIERARKAVEALGRLGQLEWIKAGCVGDVPEE